MPNSLHSSKVGPTQNFLPYGRYGNVATWHLQAKEPTRPIYGALNHVRISLTDRENSFLVCEAVRLVLSFRCFFVQETENHLLFSSDLNRTSCSFPDLGDYLGFWECRRIHGLGDHTRTATLRFWRKGSHLQFGSRKTTSSRLWRKIRSWFWSARLAVGRPLRSILLLSKRYNFF